MHFYFTGWNTYVILSITHIGDKEYIIGLPVSEADLDPKKFCFE